MLFNRDRYHIARHNYGYSRFDAIAIAIHGAALLAGYLVLAGAFGGLLGWWFA